jgi:hypothetical protein
MMTNMNPDDTNALLPEDLKWFTNQSLIGTKRYGRLLQR